MSRQFSNENPENIHALKERPNVNLTLIGDGPKNNHLKNLVNELGLEESRLIFYIFRAK